MTLVCLTDIFKALEYFSSSKKWITAHILFSIYFVEMVLCCWSSFDVPSLKMYQVLAQIFSIICNHHHYSRASEFSLELICIYAKLRRLNSFKQLVCAFFNRLITLLDRFPDSVLFVARFPITIITIEWKELFIKEFDPFICGKF